MNASSTSHEAAEHFVMRRMSLRHARVLLARRDTGNISAAADLLHVTQPAVSKTLAELEQGLGQTLFVRRGRNMQPTPLGRRLLVLAGKLDADLQRAAGDVATMVRGASGEVRIGATNAALARLLPIAITAMKGENPGVTVSVRTHALRSLFTDLLAGTLDLVVARAMPQDEPLGLARVALAPQPGLHRVELLFDLSPRQAEVRVRHREIDLGCEHIAVAMPRLQCFAEEGLGSAAAVDVGRVDEVDADVERRIEAGARLVGLHADPVGQPGPQGDFRYVEVTVAELPVLHGPSPFSRSLRRKVGRLNVAQVASHRAFRELGS